LHSIFNKIRRNNRTIYINKNFRNGILEQGLLVGETELQKRYATVTVPSSEFTRVYKFEVTFDGVSRELYFKKYLHRSVLDIIKHLVRDSRAKRAFKASLMLAENGFDVPTIIAMGECRFSFFNTRNFFVTSQVEDAKDIYHYFAETLGNLTKEQLRYKRELIRALGRTIGRMHAKAIFHGDLRLGNVLAMQENNRWRFLFLDNERTKRFRRLPFQLQLKNLVQVNMIPRHMITNTDRMRFFKEYWAENPSVKKQKKALIKKVLRKTNQRLSKKRKVSRELKKCLRKNARYLRIKTGRYVAVFDRTFCQEAKSFDFIEQIDTLVDKGQILKNGDTSYVSRLTWNDKDVVVKRYNHRGFIHSLRHTIKRSRAQRGWLHGHRLRVMGIATPKPLAYIEQRKKKLIWKSYLVTEYVKGQNFYCFLRDDKTTDQRRSNAIQQVEGLLDKLGKYRISHGDLKHTNILITENGVVLTDLDAMQAHKLNWFYKFKRSRDLERFLRETNISPNNGDPLSDVNFWKNEPVQRLR